MPTIDVNMKLPTPFRRRVGNKNLRIYSITDSEAKNKKYSVYTQPSKTSRQNPKKINFGDSNSYGQNETKSQTLSYYSRAFLIRDSSGDLTLNNVMSPNFWAIRKIWGNTHGIKEVKVESDGETYTFKLKRE